MTECKQEIFKFQGHRSRKVTADFEGGYLSSDGGALFVRGIEMKTGLIGKLAGCFLDQRFEPLVEHSVEELLRHPAPLWQEGEDHCARGQRLSGNASSVLTPIFAR